MLMPQDFRQSLITQVVCSIVQHSEFPTTPPTKLRRPLEYLAALYGTTGAKVSPTGREMYWQFEMAGWAQHNVRPPTGHREKAEDWADTRTINSMVELARNGHDGWSGIAKNILGLVPIGATNLGEMPDFDPAIALPEYSVGPRGAFCWHWGMADTPLNLGREKPERLTICYDLKRNFKELNTTLSIIILALGWVTF